MTEDYYNIFKDQKLNATLVRCERFEFRWHLLFDGAHDRVEVEGSDEGNGHEGA